MRHTKRCVGSLIYWLDLWKRFLSILYNFYHYSRVACFTFGKYNAKQFSYFWYVPLSSEKKRMGKTVNDKSTEQKSLNDVYHNILSTHKFVLSAHNFFIVYAFIVYYQFYCLSMWPYFLACIIIPLCTKMKNESIVSNQCHINAHINIKIAPYPL